MRPPSVAALIECQNRMRRDWQAFTEVWQRVKPLWRDQRQRQFTEEFLEPLPPALSRCQAETQHFQETLQRSIHLLADPELEP